MKVALALALATATSYAQVAPGSEPSPAEDTDPTHAVDPAPIHETTPPPKPPASDPPEPAAPPIAPAPPLSSPPPPDPLPITVQPIQPSPDDDVTSSTTSPETRLHFVWKLLMLPDTAVELLAIPFGYAISAIDKYKLDVRFFEFLEFFDGWIKVSPRFKLSFSDGTGLGAWVESSKLATNRARVRVGGLVRINGDYEAAIEYRHALLLPGGRGLRATVFIDHDKNRPYYGIGADTPIDDKRALRSNRLGANVDIDLHGIDHYAYSGILGFGVLRQTLSPGYSATFPPVEDDGSVGVPPGFGETATYVTASISGRRDTRDSAGRPDRGALLDAYATGRVEVTGERLSAVTVGGSAEQLLPILEGHRTLALSVSGAAAFPMFPGHTIPLDSLPQIGRLNVRGYDINRFVDRYAVVGTVEYRFPVYEYLATRSGLDAFFFVDTGTLWGNTPVRDAPFHYSVGGGIRAASQTDLEGKLTVGFSPDGFQLTVGVEGL